MSHSLNLRSAFLYFTFYCCCCACFFSSYIPAPKLFLIIIFFLHTSSCCFVYSFFFAYSVFFLRRKIVARQMFRLDGFCSTACWCMCVLLISRHIMFGFGYSFRIKRLNCVYEVSEEKKRVSHSSSSAHNATLRNAKKTRREREKKKDSK